MRQFCVRAPTCTANRFPSVQIWQTGFLLDNIAVYLYCYLDGIRCSWIIKIVILLYVSRVKPPNVTAHKYERYDNNTCSYLDLYRVRLFKCGNVMIYLRFVDLSAL